MLDNNHQSGTDRLAEIERMTSEGHWKWGKYSVEHYDSDAEVEWLIQEVKQLRERIDNAHAALTYVGPINEYEQLALYELGKTANSPQPWQKWAKRVQKLLKEEPWHNCSATQPSDES